MLLFQWANYVVARLVSVLINNTLSWAGEGSREAPCGAAPIYCEEPTAPRSLGTSPGGLTPRRAGSPALVGVVALPCAGAQGGCPAGQLDRGWGTPGLEQESRDWLAPGRRWHRTGMG